MLFEQTSQPLVSIVLCTYNGELFLRQQLDSILEQTYSNLEVIISDDASTDNTRAILNEYGHRANFQIHYQSQNQGYIKNFALTLEKAKGDFIALCDQDDIWLPNKVETLLNCFGKELLVYSDSLLIDDSGNSLGKKLSDIRNMYSGKNSKGFFLFNVVWGHALMMRRELLQLALPIPEGIPHDIWFAYKATTLGGIKYCDAVLTHYRQHQHAFTKTLLPKNVQTRTFSKRYQDYLKQLNWLYVMKQHASEEEKDFYNTFYKLFRGKEKGVFSTPLFFFTLRYQKEIYCFSKRNIISRLINLRKMARGEKP